MKFVLTYSLLLILCLSGGCSRTEKNVPEPGVADLRKVIDAMTDVMIHDVTNPPLAARFFAYACLAGNEVMALSDTACPSLGGRLNDFPALEVSRPTEAYSPSLSAVLAMLKTAQKMQPSGSRLVNYEKNLLDSCRRAGISEEVMETSVILAGTISQEVLAYARRDGYNRISNYARYTPVAGPGHWYPTPPGYFAAVEPYFNTVRPFTLDTCSQFQPLPPAPYSTEKTSAFYKLMAAVYNEKLSDEHRQIAAFWDCNPFALQENGHLLVGMKKISPGAHWMGITGIACEQAEVGFGRAMRIHTALAIGLMDGFICCWDEKYRSNRIRPETAIRRHLDPSWRPFLQTPPFPEYLSGHSTISTTSAVILTHFLGDNFRYTDTVEERYGLKARTFSSFHGAAAEAGISRFYGGIHFMDAIENGRQQGMKVGEWVVKQFRNPERLSGSAIRQN